MLHLQSYRYIYVDHSILLDPDAERLFEELAKRKVSIRLYLENGRDVKDVKQAFAFAYVSEILYGTHYRNAIEADMTQHHLRKKQIYILSKDEEIDTVLYTIPIGKEYRYACLYDLYFAYHKEIRRSLMVIGSFMFFVVAYIICYVNEWITLPSWLQTMDWLTLGVPILCLLFVIIYGLSKRLFSFFDVLDMFG